MGALPVSLFSAYLLHHELTERVITVSDLARGCQLHG